MSEPIHSYAFGPYRVDIRRRLLLQGDTVVRLAPKVFETLLVLVEASGNVVDKSELMARLWPNSFVEDGNLTLNISNLRKALGETWNQHRYIVTVPGRGYRFVAEVIPGTDEVTSGPPVEAAADHDAVELDAPESTRLPPTAATPSGRYRRRLFVAVSGLMLAGACGIAWFYPSTIRDHAPAATATPFVVQPLSLQRFAAHGGVPFRVAMSRDGKALVYQQRINGTDSLWLGQPDSNTSVPISEHAALTYGEPVFAPDGRSIYFTVWSEVHPRAVLVRMPALGGVMTELIPDVHSPITFSPDGAQLAFIRRDDETRQTSIVLADADGKNQRTLLTRTWPEAFSTLGLAWSPDGKTLAVGTKKSEGQDGLAAVSIVDGRVKTLGGRAWGVVGNLAWLADGNALVLLARQNAVARKSYVWRVSYPTGEATKVTDDVSLYLTNSLSVSADGRLAVLRGFIHSAIWVASRGDLKQARLVLQGVAPRYEGVDGLAWTPDRHLLYTAYTGDNLSIWSMTSDGGDLRQLTGSDAGVVDSGMCVTADGRYVVFQSNRSRALEIWRANTDGTGLTQLTTGGGNSLPSLSANGQWVVYTSTRDGRATLWRIGIDGSEAMQVTDRPSSWAQVSPDGTRIAYTGPADSTDGRLTIIPFEGGSPLKSFPVPRSGVIGRRVMRWAPDGRAIIYRDDLRGLWRQGLNDAQPQLVHGFEELTVQHLAWSFDGKDLAFTSGPTTQEIILIDHVK